jgi:site-specific DNA-methyltransferase (adenine-specific)
VRRYLNDKPFDDVIASERTPRLEREIADHPSLKPQSLMRRLVYAALPLGQGIVVDPFMGAGSTIAAANAVGISAVGIERDEAFFELARNAVPRLSRLHVPESDGLVGAHIEELLFQPPIAPASTAR